MPKIFEIHQPVWREIQIKVFGVLTSLWTLEIENTVLGALNGIFSWTFDFILLPQSEEVHFCQKNIFFPINFWDTAQNLFYLWGPKTQSVPQIFQLFSPSRESPWPKDHFGCWHILWLLKSLGEIKQKLIEKLKFC